MVVLVQELAPHTLGGGGGQGETEEAALPGGRVADVTHKGADT